MLLLLSGHAIAAGPPPKHTKAETVVPSVPQTQLTRPEGPAPARKPTAALTLTLDQFIGWRQDKIHQLNQVVLDKYLRLLRVTDPDDATRADLHFRIAEAYAEQQRHFRFLARGLDQRIFEARGAGRAQLEQTQKAHEAEEATRKRKAVESYLVVVRHGNYQRMDEALYRLAALLASDNRHEHAREFYLRLIREYPDSRYIPDAYLSFAQFYFEQGEVHAARKFYEKVIQFPKSPVFGYALYKRAWCDINLGDHKGALQTFVEVIRLAQAGKAGPDPAANRALERAAQGDAVKAYARSGAPSDRAWEFCARVGGELAPRMLEALAELYWEQGMFTDSTKVYHRMMSLQPDSPRLCQWQGKVVRNTQSSGAKRDQVQEIRRLGAAYDRLTANPQAKADLLAECRVALHGTGQELVQVWHHEAQKTKNPDTYLLVRELYQDHLQRFGDEKQANDLRYFYAEVLWTLRDWKEAARQYSRVVERDRRGKWARESAWAAVLAWKNLLDIDDAGRPPVKHEAGERAFKPRPISAHRKQPGRGHRHLPAAGARRPRGAQGPLQQGAGLLREQPVRAGGPPVRRGGGETPRRSPGHHFRQPAAGLAEPAGPAGGGGPLDRAVHGQPGLHEGRRLRPRPGLDPQRRAGARRQAARTGRQLPGLRSGHVAGGRVPARPPQTRRTAARRRLLLLQGASDRARRWRSASS